MLCECYHNWGSAELILSNKYEGLIVPGFKTSLWLRYDEFYDPSISALVFNIAMDKYVFIKVTNSDVCVPVIEDNIFRSASLSGPKLIEWFDKQAGIYDKDTELYLCGGKLYKPYMKE